MEHGGVVTQDDSRARLTCPDAHAELRFVVAGGPGANPPDRAVEEPCLLKCLPPNSHAGPDRVTNRPIDTLTAIRATDDPVELLGKPPWPARFPVWIHPAPRHEHPGIAERFQEGEEPTGLGGRVVVEKCDDVAGCGSNTRIAGIGQAARALVGHCNDALDLGDGP